MTITFLNHHLRKYRKAACLSQSDMSFILGLSRHSSIGHWEQDRRSPDLETIIMYNALFGVPMTEYFNAQRKEVSQQMILRLTELRTKLSIKEQAPKTIQAIAFIDSAITRLNEFVHEQ